MTYAKHFRAGPQSEPIFGEKMVPNAAGGFVFEISSWQRFRRFLILGCEGGTYYEGERKLTLENAKATLACIQADGQRAVDEIVRVSDEGLAVKNSPAIFALALATKYGTPETRHAAFQALPKVCRIGTHLFEFAECRQALGGGWGRGAREAIADWYLEPKHETLIHQVLKYRQRNGWAHRDLLRLAHPQAPKDSERAKVFDAVCRPEKWAALADTSALVHGFLQVQAATDAKQAARAVADFRLPREFVPTEFLTSPEVWAALLPHMPMTALVRNLGNLSKAGVLAPLSGATGFVVEQLTNEELVRRSRLHPFAVLLAAKTYASGRGFKGRGEWTAVPQVNDALDVTFELAFKNVVPTGKTHLLAVDVSSSMSWGHGAAICPAEAAAAMALVTARIEPNYYVMGFSTQFKDLGITARDSLATALAKTRAQNFGGTDTSVAVRWAQTHKVKADVFVVYTDNETWAGEVHTCAAMRDYRNAMGHPAKLAVVAFTSTDRSIAKPYDPLSMDFVGLDASLPQALAAFVREGDEQ